MSAEAECKLHEIEFQLEAMVGPVISPEQMAEIEEKMQAMDYLPPRPPSRRTKRQMETEEVWCKMKCLITPKDVAHVKIGEAEPPRDSCHYHTKHLVSDNNRKLKHNYWLLVDPKESQTRGQKTLQREKRLNNYAQVSPKDVIGNNNKDFFDEDS
ncbi:hypothetical protein Pcinc_008566 [Petrolisthes cinctipes]|uniref:Uncharacterized protein n=1 Tax=Petrolisthes cinctipes TaxID=88211 RepID=A0AAE1KXD1_PETCI|nr:hypothetical protein Pcinc_008566 [Petrolisthes cinctipes]